MTVNRRFKTTAFLLGALLAAGAVTSCAKEEIKETPKEEEITETMDFNVDLDAFDKSKYSAGISVHDPSVYKDGDMYYIIGTHMTMAYSKDLKTWAYSGNGYSSTNKVFGSLFTDESGEVFRFTGKKESIVPTDDKKCHLWAPDIIYNKAMGKYCMYYCTSSTWNASTLEFAVSDTIEGRYEYAGSLIYSGLTRTNYKETDVLDYVDESFVKKNYLKPDGTYNFSLYPNALDPTVFYDKDGRLWMVYGSWSGGIFLLELDEETGMVIHPESDPETETDAYYGKKLMGGGHKSIEGPYILYDPDSDYYYLFVSYGELTSDGGYQIRVFRSKEVNGDYVDMLGEKPKYVDNDHSPYGLKLSGNYNLPSLSKAYKATGHNSAIIDSDGKKFIVYHTRFEGMGEMHEPRVKQYFLNAEGWPVMLPFITDGEEISKTGYGKEEIEGKYYVVRSGCDISAEVKEPEVVYLSEGTYTAKEGSYYMSITLDGVTYDGVFCRQKDEAGNEVMCFSAAGGNQSIWGVKY